LKYEVVVEVYALISLYVPTFFKVIVALFI